MSIRKLSAIGLFATAGALLAAQAVTVRRPNPAPAADVSAPAEIKSTLRRACYDCHSDQTRWPWYSRVAPLSWLVVRDVTRGRKEVNFSQWGSYYPATRRRKLQWMGRSLREEKMPPWSYRILHPGARLTEADRIALQQWIESALVTQSAERPGK